MSNLNSSYSYSSTLRRSGSWKKTYTGAAKKIIKRRKNYELFRNNLKRMKDDYNLESKKDVEEAYDRSYDHVTGLEELRSKWERTTGRIESMGSKKKYKSDKSKEIMNKKKKKKLLDHNKDMEKKIKLYIKFVSLIGKGCKKELKNKKNKRLRKVLNKKKKGVNYRKVAKKIQENVNFTKIRNNIINENFDLYKNAPYKLKLGILKMAEKDVVERWAWARRAARRVSSAARRAAARARAAARRAAARARRIARAAAARARRLARAAAARARRLARAAAARARAIARAAAAKARAVARRAAAAARKLGKSIGSAASGMLNKLKSLGGAIFNRIKKMLMKAVNAAKRAARAVLNKVKAALNKAKAFGARMWNKVKSLSSKIANFAKKLAKMPGMLLRKAWTSISNTFKRVGRWVTNSAKKVFSGIKTIASKAFKWIKGAVKTVSRGIKSFVTKGWTWIKNTAKKLFGFFKKILVKIWNWFKKIMSRLFGFLKKLFMGKGIVARFLRFMIKILLIWLGGPPGQLIARIKYYNGTLDKWWLLIPPLSLPPLSLAPLFMFLGNKVKKGVENELPYDNGYMRTIALIGMSLPILELVFDTTWFSPFFAIYIFGAWFFIYSMRDQKKCRQVRGRRDGWQPGKFLKSASNAALMFLILRDFIEILFAAMGKLPYIGSVISVMNATPFVNVFVATSTAAVVTYVINNMLNNTPFSKYCNNYDMKKGTARATKSLISLGIYFLLYSMNFRIKDMIKSML